MLNSTLAAVSSKLIELLQLGASAFGQGMPQQYRPLDLIVFKSVHLERRMLLA